MFYKLPELSALLNITDIQFKAYTHSMYALAVYRGRQNAAFQFVVQIYKRVSSIHKYSIIFMHAVALKMALYSSTDVYIRTHPSECCQ